MGYESQVFVVKRGETMPRKHDTTKYPALSKCREGWKLIASLTDKELEQLEAELAEYLMDKDTDFCDDSTGKSLAARWYEGLMPTSELIEFLRKEA